jgi:hypothetical protein
MKNNSRSKRNAAKAAVPEFNTPPGATTARTLSVRSSSSGPVEVDKEFVYFSEIQTRALN